MKRLLILIFGVFSYLVFFATFLYLIGFTGNIFVPKGIDGELSVPLWHALFVNVVLIEIFAIQHSIMARSWFKRWWTTIIPEAAERSTFVLFSSLALLAMFFFWQPLGGIVWSIESTLLTQAIWISFFLGYGLVLLSSFQINHFDLFGLRQVWLYFRGKPYTELSFKVPFLYRYVRHPLYFGILLAFWSAPTMSYTRLLFAVVFTIYVIKAIDWEEADLIKAFGDKYRRYKARVPKLLPNPFASGNTEPAYKAIAERKQER